MLIGFKMDKIKLGITGQGGFIGSHLKNTVKWLHNEFELIEFSRNFFSDELKLRDFLSKCDVVVHLAGVNRDSDENVIYNTNINLALKLIGACEDLKRKPRIVFASSSQEIKNNVYGKSKRRAHEILSEWANQNNADFTGLIIPNVFGPFGKPYYNSVVATFCHQLANSIEPTINQDSNINLIFVQELVDFIINKISENKKGIEKLKVPFTKAISVSNLLAVLRTFQKDYLKNGIFPNLQDKFVRNLFNTFLCYINFNDFFPFKLTENSDNRGTFVELVKLNSGGQVSFSTTVPGITRGNHFHTRKAERFAVIKGKAEIKFRKIDSEQIFSFELDGKEPSFVDMPIWYTHNITNVGKDTLFTVFWINEPFNINDSDTHFLEVNLTRFKNEC